MRARTATVIPAAGLAITAVLLALTGICNDQHNSASLGPTSPATTRLVSAGSLVLGGVPADALANDGVAMRAAQTFTGTLDRATMEAQLVGASPARVVDAVLAQVTIQPRGFAARQCLCWVVSFQAGQVVMLHGPKGGSGIMLYSYTILDARTGDLVFGRGKAKPAH